MSGPDIVRSMTLTRIAALSLVVAVLTACSSSNTSTSSGTDATNTTATETTPTTSAAAATIAPTTAAPTTAAPTTVAARSLLTIDELVELGRPIVLAHSGGEDEFPGETPFAFASSFNAGVDMLDFNVQLTSDGVLVSQHDDTVDRTTNGTGAVSAMTFDQLHALDGAYWFTADCVCSDKPDAAYIYRGMRTGEVAPPTGFTPDDFAVARFSDLVERFPTMPLNIEIKGNGEPAIAAARVLADELARLDRLDNAVVTSFDDSVVTAFHEMAPSVEISPGLGAASAWVLDGTPLPNGMRILQLPPEYQGTEVLSPAMLEASKAANYPIWVWPNDRNLENAEGYAMLLAKGMAGLNINFPAAGVAAVAKASAGS